MKTRIVSESEKIANLDGDWRKATIAAKRGVMDWFGLEATLRAYIKATKNHDLDDIVAIFTGRGNELPCPNCNEMMHMMQGNESCAGSDLWQAHEAKSNS